MASEDGSPSSWGSWRDERGCDRSATVHLRASGCVQRVSVLPERGSEAGAKRAGAWERIFQKMVGSEASPERLYIYIYIYIYQKKTCRMPN
jgi:hypothetical protein